MASQLLELAKPYSVLFVDDEREARQSVGGVLSELFPDVLIAGDGETALRMFKEEKPRLLITDLQMPGMDGFALIKALRELDPELDAIILTAHEDKEFLKKALDLDVSGYLVKPLAYEELQRVLTNVLTRLTQKDTLHRMVMDEVEGNIRREHESARIFNEMLDANPNPTLVLYKGKIRFANRSFRELAGFSGQEAVVGKPFEPTALFQPTEGFADAQWNPAGVDPSASLVTAKSGNGRKIFLVISRKIRLEEDAEDQLFIFNDVTLLEYQKMKISHYNARLEDHLLRLNRERSRMPEQPAPSVPRSPAPEVPAKTPLEKREVSGTEKEVLRRSHTRKISASRYGEEVDEYVLEELQELEELEREIDEALQEFRDTPSDAGLKALGSHYLKYASTISLLFEFEDLAFAVKHFAELMNGVECAALPEGKLKKLHIMLEAILGDLENWRRTIFVDKATEDIHYLDSSLFSSCLQVELILFDKEEEVEDEGGDLDLF